ncbi:MAG: ATP-binding cassette domain-containing protein [Pseudomonadota bacterium]
MRQPEKSLHPDEKDPLLAAVARVLSCYDLFPDLTGIVAQLPRIQGPLTLDDLTPIAQRLSLELKILEGNRGHCANFDSPLILCRSDGTEPEVVLPSQLDSRTQEFNEAEELQPCFIVLIAPSRQASDMDLSNMQRGHALDWFWQPLKTHWRQFSEVLVCTAFINLFVLFIPLFTLSVYDQVIPNFADETLVVLAVGVCVALVFDFIMKSMRTYLLERITAETGAQYDQLLMSRVLNIPNEYMPLSVGERSNLFRELQGIREFYASRLVPTAVDLPFFLLFMAVIYVISPILTVIPVIGALIIITINAVVQIPVTKATANFFSANQQKSSLLVETLQGANTFKLANALGPRLFRWQTAASNTTQNGRLNQFLFGMGQNASVTCVHLVHVLVIVVGVYQVQSGLLTVGGLIACSILASRAIAPVVNVGGVVSRWRQARDVLGSIDTLFQLPFEQADEGVVQRDLDGAISINSLSYTYPGQTRPALTDISLDIKPGERVGLIGPTGAGKSTLAGVLTGMMRNYQGEIRFNGQEIRSLAPACIRDQMAVVPQTPFYVNGSIRDNILLGLEATDNAIEQALDISGLQTIIRQTGYGLDSPVGENGSNLSGGQRQAVAIARALIKNPKIIVFDEGATGFDAILETQLKLKLDEYLKDRTFIMITHRTSMLELVQRLVLMHNGSVVRDGSRDEVIEVLNGTSPSPQPARINRS